MEWMCVYIYIYIYIYTYIYNGILLSHKKEWNNTICSNIDGPRNYHTNQLNGHEFEQTLADSEGQGSLAVHEVAKSQTQLSN